MNPHYASVAARAGHRCEYCRAPEAVFNFPFEVEHIVPTSRGGADDASNLALACRSCNIHKGIHVIGFAPGNPTEVRLFRPRDDRWDQHFEAIGENGWIVGTTEIGRATVFRLKLNGEIQRAARAQWVRLGLFP